LNIVVIGTVSSSIVGFRREFINSLIAKGHKVYAFAVDYTDETRQQVTAQNAVPVDYVFNRTGMNPIRDIYDTWQLAKQLKRIKPDLVFSYFVKPVVFGTFAAKLAGVERRVAMLEGLGFVFTDQPEGISIKIRLLRQVQVLLYRFSFPLLDKIIFLNRDDPQDLIAKYNLKVKRVEVLGGIGLDLRQYPYVKPNLNELSFLFIGRLLKEKGINEFVAAAKIVKQQYPDVIFTVLGGLDQGNPGGLNMSELNHLIKTGVIDYPGHVTNMAERIAQCSVFVLPSYREGIPRSTQEAMAVGRPVITTDVPGCRETVIESVNGFMVPPWQPQSLADRMLYFIKHPKQIELMGLESYKMAQKKFNSKIVNQKLLRLLEL